MVNITSLMEAVSGGGIGNIPAHEFLGTLDEACSDVAYYAMSEGVSIREFVSEADEIMIEAAITDPSRVSVISEASLSKLKEKVVAFFKKIIAMIAGLLAKIRAFFEALFKKTSSWISHMESKVKDAWGKSNAKDITYEMYKWDVKYLTEDLPAACNEVANWVKSDMVGSDLVSKINSAKMSAKDIVTNNDNTHQDTRTPSSGSDEDNNATVKRLNEIKTNAEKAGETRAKSLISTVITKLGVTPSSNSPKDIYSAVKLKVCGGGEKKVPVAIAAVTSADSAIDFVKNYKTTKDNMETAYKTTITGLNNVKSTLEGIIAENNDTSSVTDSKIKTSLDSAISAICSTATSQCTTATAMISNISNISTSSIKSAVGDYMMAMNRLVAGAKDKK